MRFFSTLFNPMGLLLLLPGIIIAICFHEFAHAWAAVKLGDETPRTQGRLSLAPDKHIDLIGFLLLIFAGFGWGKPVQINPRNFNKPSRDEMLVSLAGPAMNLIIAILTSIILQIILRLEFLNNLSFNTLVIIIQIISGIFRINIALGIFNLIPLPPLDGSKILMHFLPYNARNWFINHETYFYYGFLILWITGLSAYIISPIIDSTAYGISYIITSVFNLF